MPRGSLSNLRKEVSVKYGLIVELLPLGAPWALCITPPSHQVIHSSDSRPGHIYKLDLNGKILGEFGEAGKQPGEFAGCTRWRARRKTFFLWASC